MKKIALLLCSVLTYNTTANTDCLDVSGDIVAVDRGRITPFGRTFDLYIKTNGRRPLALGASWPRIHDDLAVPFRWETEGEFFFNRNLNTQPTLENSPEAMEYWLNKYECPNINGVYDCEPGEYFFCMQDNPYNNWLYSNHEVSQRWDVIGPYGIPRWNEPYYDSYWDKGTSWLVMNHPGFIFPGDINGAQATPRIDQSKGLLLQNDYYFEQAPTPYDGYESYECGGYNYNEFGKVIEFGSGDWEDDEMENHYRFARMTGIDRIAISGVIIYSAVDCQDLNFAEPVFFEYEPDNSCPADLDEDGRVGFSDLLTVLSDNIYAPGARKTQFDALVEVISQWGDCQ
jgi:hypothetical protein